MEAPIDVVGRVARLLRAVSVMKPSGNTTALARETGLPRPTAHRLLTALLDVGMVDRDRAGRWGLGPELYVLGLSAARNYDVTAVAQPFMHELALKTGESAFFWTRRGDEAVCLLREDGSFPIRSHVNYEGIRFPLDVGSQGIAILAHLPAPESRDILLRRDPTRVHGPPQTLEAVLGRIAETRRLGYSVNTFKGDWGLSAAVFDSDEAPRWALSLTGNEQRFTAARRAALGRALLQAAHGLSQALQHK